MKSKERIQSLIREAAQPFAAAFRWWLSELTALVPSGLRVRFCDQGQRHIVYIDAKEAVVCVLKAGEATEVQRVPLIDLPAPSAQEAPAWVIIPADEVFTDRFWLPANVKGRLRQVLAFEAERRNPFRSQDTLFDFSVVGRDEEQRALDIEWALVPAELVQRARDITRSLGFFPAKIGIEGEAPGQFRYVFAGDSAKQPFRLTPLTAGVAASAAFLVSALAYACIAPLQAASTLERNLESVKGEAQGAQAIKVKAEQLATAISYVARRANEQNTSSILAELTKALPDDTWVTTFELKSNEARLIGYSASASSLIETLSLVPSFGKPHFRAAITPASNSKIERFDIAFSVRDRSDLEDAP